MSLVSPRSLWGDFKSKSSEEGSALAFVSRNLYRARPTIDTLVVYEFARLVWSLGCHVPRLRGHVLRAKTTDTERHAHASVGHGTHKFRWQLGPSKTIAKPCDAINFLSITTAQSIDSLAQLVALNLEECRSAKPYTDRARSFRAFRVPAMRMLPVGSASAYIHKSKTSQHPQLLPRRYLRSHTY